jgi:hypothetical protein
MNTISTKINAILLATMVATAPVCASENQSVVIISEQQDAADTQDSVVWYKKCSTKHVIAGLAATAIGLYALAVRKNKIAGPIALLTALSSFCAKKNIAEVKDGNQNVGSKEVGGKKVDTKVDSEQPQIKNTEKSQDLHIVDNEKPEVSVQENGEDHKSVILTPENQKTVEQDITSVDLTQNQPKNDQSEITPGNVEKNILPTHEAPSHIKAQQYAQGVLSSIKNWFAAGLVDEDLSQN